MEKWVDIKYFEGCYQISSKSRVKSLKRVVICKNGMPKTIREKILVKVIDSAGYEVVGLCKDGVSINKKVHRIMADAFIPKVENKLHVNHKNGVKSDNRIENIEWCTDSENALHAYNVIKTRKSPYKGRLGAKAVNSKKVRCDTFGITFGAAAEAARFFDLTVSGITGVCRGERKQIVGLNFSYI